MKVKYNEKYIRAIEAFINISFGEIEEFLVYETEQLKFNLFHILPTEQFPYHIMVTDGVSAIKPKIAPKGVKGLEFFMVLPKEWKFSTTPDFDDGYVLTVFQELAEILLKGGVLIPGSTVKFEHLKNSTKHNAVVVDITSREDMSVFPTKKGDILFFEIQTVHKDEYDRLFNDDEELLLKIMALPCVDTLRDSLV